MSRSQKITFVKMDPGGNVTILVTGGVAVNRPAVRAAIASELLDQRHLHAEQVGFVHPASLSLEMMGGEFCGNAARALTAYILLQKGVPEWSGRITVSGVTRPLEAWGRRIGEAEVVAEVEMPCRRSLDSVRTELWKEKEVAVVEIEGITHILLDQANHPFPADWEREAAEIRAAFGVEELPAVGTIWYTEGDRGAEIKPVVRVRETATTYYETACGSGTLALGLFAAKRALRGISDCAVRQPSGEELQLSITLDETTQQFTHAAIRGPVRMVAEGSAWLFKNQH